MSGRCAGRLSKRLLPPSLQADSSMQPALWRESRPATLRRSLSFLLLFHSSARPRRCYPCRTVRLRCDRIVVLNLKEFGRLLSCPEDLSKWSNIEVRLSRHPEAIGGRKLANAVDDVEKQD